MEKESYIKALEAERAGDWEQAHRIVQEIDTKEAAWVHAYLHRVEGDPGNAAYWYRRAGKPECRSPLKEEWWQLFDALQ
ncbi:hypothetical protein [Pontiella sp.]|uniref:hypothetical protein n=1 Tax=Pontiella sp. TaxID=2837462 RepID=UPI003567C2C2